METTLLHPPNLVDRELFTFSLNHEVHKAVRLQYPLSLLCLTLDRPPAESTRALIPRLARLSARRVRATDLAASLDPSSVAILLIDAQAHNLPGILERLTEEIEPTLHLTVSAGGGCYPKTASSGDGLIEQATELMRRANAEGGDRLYLPT